MTYLSYISPMSLVVVRYGIVSSANLCDKADVCVEGELNVCERVLLGQDEGHRRHELVPPGQIPHVEDVKVQ
jgi:hypothetical protein